MVPTSAVLEVVGEAAEVGISNLVILTAGFGETGDEGVERERNSSRSTREHQLTVLGPNGNGFVNVAGGVTPFGLPIQPPLESGPVGVVLQSGGMASVVLTAALGRGIGVSLLVSTGNEAVTSATDVMRYLIADDETRVVAAFLESVRDPDEFREVAGLALEAGKPLVVLKVGRSEIGAQVAQAHTGALADDDRVVSAAFEQLGVIQVDSLEEMVATVGYLGHHPGVRGRRIAAVTASGGVCNLVADQCAVEGLELPEFPPETLEELGQILPEFSNPHNPLDVTGYIVVDPSISGQALRTVARQVEGHYDILLYQMGIPTSEPADPSIVERRFDFVVKTRAEVPVPLVLLGVMNSNSAPVRPTSARRPGPVRPRRHRSRHTGDRPRGPFPRTARRLAGQDRAAERTASAATGRSARRVGRTPGSRPADLGRRATVACPHRGLARGGARVRGRPGRPDRAQGGVRRTAAQVGRRRGAARRRSGRRLRRHTNRSCVTWRRHARTSTSTECW